MPIKKNQSKNIPGKGGYSYGDRLKLLQISSNPDEYYEPELSDRESTNRLATKIFMISIIIVFLILCVLAAIIGH